MKCQILFSGKKVRKIFEYVNCLKIYPVLRVTMECSYMRSYYKKKKKRLQPGSRPYLKFEAYQK